MLKRCVLSLALVLASTTALAQSDHWVTTWSTALMDARNVVPPPRPTAGAPAPPATPSGPLFGGSDTTLRQIAHVSIGGRQVRIVLSNEFATTPLQIAAGSVAMSTGNGAILSESAHPLMFGGKPAIVIPAGAAALSDPVDLQVAPLSDVAVSIFLPQQTIGGLSMHYVGDQANFQAPGNAVGAPTLADATEFTTYQFLESVQVLAPSSAGAIVALGDSITDGAFASKNANMRWPDELARRLQADKRTRNLAVVNEGISGNRVLHDGSGPNALARFGRDVLGHPGVRYLIVMEGINDIGRAYGPRNPMDVVTAEDLIQAYSQMIERAHEHGIRVIGATLTPYGGAAYASPDGERVRYALNEWIRQPGHFDGVIDFDKATRDPAKPDTFLPTVDHGDHLHPGDAGYRIMGDSIDLGLFTK